ncbi:Putative flippase GtrA (transmembrane translocase of bactoprenol-linked glucose) [Enhydrobacter aerosaccus]|uniref:Putative flippase GtrA (Transmembrane translocase of bactoprenol-linked glucose) n=1 Tax=Enhydrobacter aerosaccus TaxID=225324 RepID=A0A1T4TEQ3_9HYPH|nr:GtrA family protein [Enhydrobacter aerosaccus]SKA38718.1 Putative flippase GtrA (transmembrane translocase of bactoprenol-linked glucose) [Enhydrobacter aerosaccus]
MLQLVGKLLRYGMTGGIAAIVDAGGFALLVGAGIGVAAAGISSFCIAALVNYGLTSRFVFRQRKTVAGFALFFVFALVGVTVNVGTMLGTIHWLGVPPLVGKVAGIATAFLINFALNATIVFRVRPR